VLAGRGRMQFCGTADALVRAQWTLSTLRLKPLDVQVYWLVVQSTLTEEAGTTLPQLWESLRLAAADTGEHVPSQERCQEAVDALMAKLLIREHPGSTLMLALCAFDCTPELWDGPWDGMVSLCLSTGVYQLVGMIHDAICRNVCEMVEMTSHATSSTRALQQELHQNELRGSEGAEAADLCLEQLQLVQSQLTQLHALGLHLPGGASKLQQQQISEQTTVFGRIFVEISRTMNGFCRSLELAMSNSPLVAAWVVDEKSVDELWMRALSDLHSETPDVASMLEAFVFEVAEVVQQHVLCEEPALSVNVNEHLELVFSINC